MKYSKSFIVFFFVLFAVEILLSNIKYNDYYAYSNEYKTIKNEYKTIRIIDIDTTGDKVKEKVKILADEKNKGYIVKIYHNNNNNKVYTLEPDKNFKFIAPYT